MHVMPGMLGPVCPVGAGRVGATGCSSAKVSRLFVPVFPGLRHSEEMGLEGTWSILVRKSVLQVC